MLLQTNSYIVPKEKRTEHARLLQRFRQTLARLGCDHFEAYEQVGVNWGGGEPTGRFVQIMRFRDKQHHQSVQNAEKNDPAAQALIKEFCELINFPYQQQQGLFVVGFYNSVLPIAHPRSPRPPEMPTQVHPHQDRGESTSSQVHTLHGQQPSEPGEEDSQAQSRMPEPTTDQDDQAPFSGGRHVH